MFHGPGMDRSRKLRTGLRFATAFVAIAGMTLSVASCSSDSGEKGGSASGQTLHFAIGADVPNLVTPKNQGSASMLLNAALHRGLVQFDADGQVVPALAEKWEEAEDGKTYTFTLRSGLTFHDGSALTGEDVKATLEHMIDPDNVAKLYPAAKGIESIETPDDTTVVVHLSAPDAAFISYLADVSGAILPSEEVDSEGPTYIGAGPFKFVSHEEGTEFVVEAFDGFYEADQPSIGKIEFEIIPDQTARDNAVLGGSVEAAEFIGWNNYSQFEGNTSLTLDATEGPFMYLIFNTTDQSPFSNPLVREAVAWAVDRDAVVDAALGGVGSPLAGMPIPASSEFYNEKQANYYTQDLTKAKALLAEAGYPDGFTATMLASSQYAFHQDTAISVQNDLAKIGITLEMNLPDWPTRLELGADGAYDIAVYGTAGITNDPAFLDQLLTPNGATNSSFGYDDETVNRLLAEGRAATDPDERKAIYDELGDFVLKDAPIVGLGWRSQAYGYSNKLTGFSNIPGFLTFNSGYLLASAKLG